jgi:hypothetical protein
MPNRYPSEFRRKVPDLTALVRARVSPILLASHQERENLTTSDGGMSDLLSWI